MDAFELSGDSTFVAAGAALATGVRVPNVCAEIVKFKPAPAPRAGAETAF